LLRQFVPIAIGTRGLAVRLSFAKKNSYKSKKELPLVALFFQEKFVFFEQKDTHFIRAKNLFLEIFFQSLKTKKNVKTIF
jgi:hypothetical protein